MNAHLRLFAGKPRGKAGGKRGKQAPCGENLLNLRKLPQKEAGTRDEKTKENAVPHHRRSGSGAGAQAAAASAHVGGELAHKLKFAGWDFVIIEGEAKSPVYLYIHNEKVEIRDASAAWGQGTRRSAEVLAKETTPEASFGVIGQAGENLVPMPNMMRAGIKASRVSL